MKKNPLITMSDGTTSVINTMLVGIITAAKEVGSINQKLTGYPGRKGTLEESLIDLIDTPILRVGFSENVEGLVQLGNYHPLKHVAEPEETDQIVLFLAALQSSFITGVTVNIDGGIGCLLARSGYGKIGSIYGRIDPH